MDRVLEWHQLWKLTQDYTENLNDLITIKAMEFIIENLYTKKTLSPPGLSGEFFEILKNK